MNAHDTRSASRHSSAKYILVFAVLIVAGLPAGHLRTFGLSLFIMGFLASSRWSRRTWLRYWWLLPAGSGLTTILKAQHDRGAMSTLSLALIVLVAVASIGYAFLGGGRAKRRFDQDHLC